MEPPCEHGGVLVRDAIGWRLVQALQWSRRVNTAECSHGFAFARRQIGASMEPPCEHGGVSAHYAVINQHCQ